MARARARAGGGGGGGGGAGGGMAAGRAARSVSVAVVGAGAAGLASVRALRREGLAVTAFEARPEAGGTWVLEAGARGAQSSLYDSLRTNLPREVMGFQELPFTGAPGTSPYCGHREVRQYLEAYAEKFDLKRHIRFGERVVSARRAPRGGGAGGRAGWLLEIDGGGEQKAYEETFDALMVCNGHYTEARFPAEAAACESFTHAAGCSQTHSHEYREPGRFRGKRVVLVGGGPSAMDLSAEIASVAEEVFLSARVADPAAFSAQLAKINAACGVGIQARPWVRAAEPGLVHFEGGGSARVDAIVWCTGYHYSFPWLDLGGGDLGGDCLEALYRHVFLPEHAPELSFVGVPFKVAPFPQFELQAAWVAACLAGRRSLPPETEMRRRAADELRSQRERFALPRHTHQLGGLQWDYNDLLAEESGFPPLAGWRRQVYDASKENRAESPGDYRDKLPEGLEQSLAQALQDFGGGAAQ